MCQAITSGRSKLLPNSLLVLLLLALVACGESGQVNAGSDDDDDTGDGTSTSGDTSSQILFASQYDLIEGANNEPYATSQESGDVIAFSDADGSGFEYDDWGLGVAPDGGSAGDYMQQRQAYGLQFAHSTAVDSSHYFGLVVKAPGNADLNISKSDTLVIQMGNGASTDVHPNSHMTFTVELNGGTYSDNSWSNSCSFDQELLADSRPGDDQASWGNPYGIHTYRIALSGFTCSAGDLSALQSELEEVAIKVVGGKDADASASTSGNSTLLQFGFITFVNSSGPVNGDSEYLLFASQYETIDGATNDPYVRSNEGGNIFSFSGNGFVYDGYSLSSVAGEEHMIQRQAYGIQFAHGSPIDETGYFGLAVKAPNNGYLDVSEAETIILQIGNGASTEIEPNSHMVFTVELNGGEQAADFSWSYSCSYDQTLLANSRPLNNEGGTNATWGNPYGIHTYRIALSEFTCSNGNLSSLKADLEEVVVKVVGDKDSTASASSTGNATLLQFGHIAFGPSEL